MDFRPSTLWRRTKDFEQRCRQPENNHIVNGAALGLITLWAIYRKVSCELALNRVRLLRVAIDSRVLCVLTVAGIALNLIPFKQKCKANIAFLGLIMVWATSLEVIGRIRPSPFLQMVSINPRHMVGMQGLLLSYNLFSWFKTRQKSSDSSS